MQTLKVFVSSPGDVREEREIVGRVVERIEARYWNFVRLDSVLWESELVRATGHFNEEIVRPSECDVVLSVLWRRLGSLMPPQFLKADGTRFQSGTEWEIEDAVAGYEARRRAKAEGKSEETPFPDVVIFRREAPAPADPPSDAAEQSRKLDTFWRRFMLHPDGTIRRAFHTYAALKDFERSVEELLEEAVRARLPRLTATQEVIEPVPLQGSPFKGLASFEAEDAPLFFGREKSIGEALRQLRAQAEKGCPFLLIYGGSGSGKSSLMKAGLTPRLTRPGWLPGVETWRRAALLPGQGEGSLVEKLARALRAALPAGASLGRLGEQLAAAPAEAARMVSATLVAEAQRAGHAPAAARLLLEIDQLEEVFTTLETDDAGRDAFFAALAALAGGGTWIVATMRSEFFPRVARHPDLLTLVRAGSGHILAPPRPEDLARMVRCPAMAAGLGFQRHPQTAQDLSEAILDQAQRNPEALPLLQFCLQRLWEQREGRVLTWAACEAMGGLEGAIARAAGDTFARLHAHEREAGRRVFAELVQVNDDDQLSEVGPALRRRAALEAAQNAAPGADIFVAAFVGEKLLVTEGTATGATLALAHEALLTHWPELALWVTANRRLLASRRRLESAAAEWTQASQDRGLLLRDRRLRDAEEVAESGLFHLRAEEQSLLAESHRLKRRGRRVRQGVFAGAIALAAAASVAAVLAVQNAARAVAARGGAEELISFMTFELRDRLAPVGRLSLMDGVNKRVEEYYRRFPHGSDAPELLRRRSAFFSNQGNAKLAKGDLAGALQLCRDALAICTRLVAQNPENVLWQHDLSVNYDNVGNVFNEQGDLVGALKSHNEALAIRERLFIRNPANASWQLALSVSYAKIGNALHSQGDLAGALKAHRDALAILELLAAQNTADVGRRRDLYATYSDIGDVLHAQGDLDGALKARRDALAIVEILTAQEPANSQWQHDLSLSHPRVGDVLQAQGDLNGALKAYRAGLAVTERLTAQDSANAKWQSDLAICWDRISGIQQQTRAWQEAAEAAGRGLEITRSWMGRPDASPQWSNLFAIAAGRRWEMLRDAPPESLVLDRAKVIADLRKAVEARQQLNVTGRLDASGKHNLTVFEQMLREAEK